MSLFVCSKCGCIDNTATSCYWALIRPCKNRIYDKLQFMKGKKVDIRLGRGLANQIKINKTIPVSHKPKEERRMMFICGDDIASIIKRFENESK